MSQAPPCYYCCGVGHSRAIIDEKASGLVREEPWTCEECHTTLIMRTSRVALKPGSWSGEDVFFARGFPGTILTSERFRDLCVEKGFVNCNLIPADEYGFDFYPGKPGGYLPSS